MTRPVAFTEDGARRIVAATRAYEGSGRDQPPIKFRQPSDDGGGGVRLGQVGATWSKGSTATVTLLKPDGTAVSPAATFEAKNWFATVTVSSGAKRVACAQCGDTWILIAAEC